MGISAGAGSGMAAIHATVAALAVLDAEDAALAAAGASAVAGDGVDVLQRAYEIRLERMGLEKKLEAQAAAWKARSVAEAMDLQHAIIPRDAPPPAATTRPNNPTANHPNGRPAASRPKPVPP